MNSPFDAHLNQVVEEAESRNKQSVEKYSPPVQQANRSIDDAESGAANQNAEKIQVPGLKNIWQQQDESAPDLEISTSRHSEPKQRINKRVLVADDLPVNRKLIGIQLQKLGYEVEQAENGLEVVEKVRKEEFGLIFMDLEMPLMDGYQAAIEIRQIDHENRQHTPIIALTSYTSQTEKQRSISSGMDNMISKGISGKKLQDMVARYIRKKIVVEAPAPKPKQKELVHGVEIDIQLLHDTHGNIEEEIVDISLGAMKTFIGCLKCALEDRDVLSIKHFVSSIKGPCTTLGLKSMNKLAGRIYADAAKNNWETAGQGMALLESQYCQILDQLTGLSATLHRVNENSDD